MRSIDTSRSETISFCETRSAPDERSGDRSGCQVSSQNQTTVKIRCIVDSLNVEADSEPRQRPRNPHAGANSALMLHLDSLISAASLDLGSPASSSNPSTP